MKKAIATGLLMLAAAGAQAASDTVIVQRPTPYAQDNDIADNIKQECKITEQLPDAVAEFAREKGITVQLVPQASESSAGRVLVLEISDALSGGNAFIGHQKSVTVKGRLYEGGKLLGDFRARRNSMGGAFAGFKGSCSVLGRAVNAIGEDIAGWLTAPQSKSRLGDQ